MRGTLDVHDRDAAQMLIAGAIGAKKTVLPTRMLPGQRINQYQIVKPLGEGGMGVVYLVEDIRLQRKAALKFVTSASSTRDESMARFLREARTAAQLNHPNICTVYELGEAEGKTFISMEFVSGTTLKERIEAGDIDQSEIESWLKQIAEGLRVAHDAGIIHRDIKPANIMITHEGLIKIMDFGLARLAGSELQLTEENSTLGTLAYMSPEQARGEPVDPRTDIWSVGVVLYELLTGTRPFTGDYPAAILYAVINQDIALPSEVNPDVSPQLESIVVACLQRDRELRYPSLDGLLADLTSAQKRTHDFGSTDELKPAQRKWISSPRKKWVVGGLAALVLILLGAISTSVLYPSQILASVARAKPLVVMPFENQTGDASLDYLKASIPNLLITNIEQSKYLDVLTWERMNDLLKQMGRDNVEVVSIDRETGFEICRLDGVHGIVLGSFTKAGETFAIDIKVLDVESKKTLASTNTRGRGVDSILETQIDALSDEISQVAALLPEDFPGETLRVADVTTNSIQAFRHYFDGIRHYDDVHKARAEVSLLKALEFDSTFAMAWYQLGALRMRLQNISLATDAFENALRYSERATAKEQLFINMAYAEYVEGDLAKATVINEELIDRYPREKSAIFALGRKYQIAGRIEDAIRAVELGVSLDPSFRSGYNVLGYMYVATGQYEKAEAAFRAYIKYYPENPNPYDSLAELYWMWGKLDEAIKLNVQAFAVDSTWVWSFMRNAWNYAMMDNYPQAFRELDEATRRGDALSSPAMRTLSLYYAHVFRAICLWNLGRSPEAIADLRRAFELAQSRSNTPYMIIQAEILARLYADMQRYDEAEAELEKLLHIGLAELPRDSVRWHLKYAILSGTFDVYRGHLESARMHSEYALGIISKVKHETVELDRYNLVLLEGELALATGRHRDAITLFSEAPLPNPYIETRYLDYLIPVRRDGLARAYYAAGEIDKAIESYRRLTKYYPDFGGHPVRPIVHYHLARFYQEKGWSGLARQAYEEFLERWKDADASWPALIHAREQLKTLKSAA